MFEVYAQTRYQQLEQIGVGEGMNSLVFRAFDPYLHRELAVKEIEKARLGNDFNDYCAEARAMFASAHPNIVAITYVCETPDHIALALPYFANGSLKSRITLGPLSLRQFLRTAHGVLSGMVRIHSQKFVHLDVKPSNVLFDDNDVPLVGDFGQARRVGPGGTVTFPAIYKWAMPPEVWNSHVATVESDIYQIGVLLYRSVNGEPVYQAQKASVKSDSELQARIQRGRFPDTRLFLPHVPKRIRTIIRKAVKAQPADRYHAASEVAIALGKVALPLDWTTIPIGGGAYRWLASRPEMTDLEVELSQDGPSQWATKVWTVSRTEKRAKGLAAYWRKGFSYEGACKHLTEVFAELSR